MTPRGFPPPWSPRSLAHGAPGLTRWQNFSVIKTVLKGAVDVLARLICTRCRADVESVLRCRRCGALCPTSEIGAAMLSPGAFTFYVFVLVVVAIFWFA
jgi:hypothetical protein